MSDDGDTLPDLRDRDSMKETVERTRTTPDRRATEASTRASFAQLPVGTELGRYVILELRGAGGMGVVYGAYDPKLDRKVALKLVRRETDDGEADARLLREAQAMAKLAHPNVVTVHDAAILGDAVCIEMEYVDGVTLEQWTHGKAWPEILDVYVQAGRALAAAHEKGLVHRDFKPTNAIVDATGRVRVLDFGLARAVEIPGDASDPDLADTGRASTTEEIAASPTSLPTLPRTMTGLSAGTPAFMPPEQWRGKPVDGRADQYAFAASLFEALYGVLPFPTASYAAMKSAAARGSIATRPAGSKVPAWIDRAIVKALAYEPLERHASMDALLEALSRDPAASSRRRFVAVGAAAIAIVLALAGARHARTRDANACVLNDRLDGVWDDAKKASVKAAITKHGDAVGSEAWAKTSATLDAYASSWLTARTATCEEGKKGRAASDAEVGARLVCLDTRLRELRVLTDVLARDSDVVHEATTAASNLSPVADCAVASKRRSPRPPDDPVLFAKAEAIRGKILEADSLRASGRPKAAKPIAITAVEEARAAHLRGMEGLALLVQGRAEHEEGDYKAAAATLELGAWASEAGGDDETLVTTTTVLAFVTGYRLADAPAGARWTKHASAALERYGPSDAHAGELDRVRSSLARQRKELDEARKLAESSLAANLRARGPNDLRTGHSEMNLASTYVAMAKLDDAMKHFERSREIFEAALGPSHPTVAAPLVNEAIVLRRRGDSAGAIALYDRALAIYVPAQGPNHPDVMLTQNNRALALAAAGRHEEAQATFEKLLEQRRKTLGSSHPLVASSLGSLAWSQRKTKRFAEARASLDEAIAIHEKTGGVESAAVAFPLLERAELALEEKKPKDALPLAERALKLREKRLGHEHPDVGSALTMLGRIHTALGDHARAIEELERSVSMLGKDNPRDRAETELSLARVLRALDRDPARALTLARSAETSYAKDENASKEQLAEVRAWIATNEKWLASARP